MEYIIRNRNRFGEGFILACRNDADAERLITSFDPVPYFWRMTSCPAPQLYAGRYTFPAEEMQRDMQANGDYNFILFEYGTDTNYKENVTKYYYVDYIEAYDHLMNLYEAMHTFYEGETIYLRNKYYKILSCIEDVPTPYIRAEELDTSILAPVYDAHYDCFMWKGEVTPMGADHIIEEAEDVIADHVRHDVNPRYDVMVGLNSKEHMRILHEVLYDPTV